MDKAIKTQGIATETKTTEEEALPSGLTSRDARDLAWFFFEAEGELAPSPAFSIFDRACHGVACSLGGSVSAPEPSDAQVAAAGRARRIDQILDSAGQETTRVLQRWCAPARYFSKTVQRELGRLAGVALRSDWCGSMDDLTELCERATGPASSEEAKVRRHAARVRLAPLKADAARMLEAAARAFVAARAAHDANAPRPRLTPAQRAIAALKRSH